MKTILVTGSQGQLAAAFRGLNAKFKDLNFCFAGRDQFDITQPETYRVLLENHRFDAAINLAAYTNVDEAEKKPRQAYSINSEGVKNLSFQLRKYAIPMVHISTDYVFNGLKQMPYTEEDLPDPLNVYGASKLKGESYALAHPCGSFVIRTSWLFSEQGSNFYLKIKNLVKTKKTVYAAKDQKGSPTYAGDLAYAVCRILPFLKSGQNQIYHCASPDSASRYELTRAIVKHLGVDVKVSPASLNDFSSSCRRPHNSVLDSSAFQKRFDFTLPSWKKSLSLLKSCGFRDPAVPD